MPVLFSAYPSLVGAVENKQVKLLAHNGAGRWFQAPDGAALYTRAYTADISNNAARESLFQQSLLRTNTTDQSIKFKVKVQLREPPPDVKPGLSVEADILTGFRAKALAGGPLAVVDDQHVIDRVLHLGELMRRHEHGSPLGRQMAQQLAQPHDADGVEAVGRLVEHEHPPCASARTAAARQERIFPPPVPPHDRTTRQLSPGIEDLFISRRRFQCGF